MKEKSKKKKSQVEVVGLLIIVMIISFILLFALRTLFRPPSDAYQQFKSESLASSMISAMLRTTTDCSQSHYDMSDLLIDCALWKGSSYSGNIMCDNGQNSCEYFQDTAEMMLNETVTDWGNSFEMIIIEPGGRFETNGTWLMHSEGGIRSKKRSASTATPYLPLGFENGAVGIMLCVGEKCPV